MALSRGSRLPSAVHDVEEAHPAELGELRLVRVEHVQAGRGELDLEDAALPLTLHDRVRVLPALPRSRRLVAEEVRMQVERVDQVELGEVGKVDPNQLRALHADRVARV